MFDSIGSVCGECLFKDVYVWGMHDAMRSMCGEHLAQ
jgi:hypothetical protein